MSVASQSIKKFNGKLETFFARFSFRDPVKRAVLSILIFVAGLHLFNSYTGIYKFISTRPCSIHISAQTSRAAIALNYYENNMNFFTPQNQRNMKGEAYTGLEFPVVYYMGAICYRLFGFNEAYLRVISLVITSVGLLFFFLLSLKFTKSNWLSLGIIAAVICSPVFIFYVANFMPDPPSVGMILGGWYFLFRYIGSHSRKHLNWFIALSTLGVLLKVTGAICFVIVVCLLVLDHFKFFKNAEREYLFPKKKGIVIRLLAAAIVIVSWYKYSAWFPRTHGGAPFFLTPNMYDSWDGLVGVLGWMKKLWLNHYYSYESYVLLGGVAAVIVLGCLKASRLLLTITLLYILGCLAYFFFFLNQFMHHDYYIITMFPALFFLFLCFADVMTKISDQYFYPLKLVLLVVLFFNLKESFIKARANMQERYGQGIYYWTGDFRAYEDLEPKLRKLGIKREDRVISAFDYTDCASLYLMNQLGMPLSKDAAKNEVDEFLHHPNARYLVLNDSATFRKMYGYDLTDKVLTTHRGLIVYKLR
jgi:hypothetical protein